MDHLVLEIYSLIINTGKNKTTNSRRDGRTSQIRIKSVGSNLSEDGKGTTKRQGQDSHQRL